MRSCFFASVYVLLKIMTGRLGVDMQSYHLSDKGNASYHSFWQELRTSLHVYVYATHHLLA